MYAYLKSFFEPKENLAFEEKPSIYSKTKSSFNKTANVIFNQINFLAQFMFRKITESISFIKNKFSSLFKKEPKPEQKNNFGSTKFNTTAIVNTFLTIFGLKKFTTSTKVPKDAPGKVIPEETDDYDMPDNAKTVSPHQDLITDDNNNTAPKLAVSLYSALLKHNPLTKFKEIPAAKNLEATNNKRPGLKLS